MLANRTRIPGPQGSALGFGGAIVATLAGHGLGAADQPLVALVLLATVVLGVGSLTTVPGAVGAGAQCWGLYSGFVLHRFGELRLDGSGAPALLLLLALGVAASVAARLPAVPRPRRATLPLPRRGGARPDPA